MQAIPSATLQARSDPWTWTNIRTISAAGNAAKNFVNLFGCFLLRFRFRRFGSLLFCRSRFRDFREYFLNPADINIHRQARDDLSDHFQGHILKLLEAHTTPAHLELLSAVLPRFLEPRLQLRICVTAHPMKS